jgi:hypothetical protein
MLDSRWEEVGVGKRVEGDETVERVEYRLQSWII